MAWAAVAGLTSDFLGALLWVYSLEVGSVAVAATVASSTPFFASLPFCRPLEGGGRVEGLAGSALDSPRLGGSLLCRD